MSAGPVELSFYNYYYLILRLILVTSAHPPESCQKLMDKKKDKKDSLKRVTCTNRERESNTSPQWSFELELRCYAWGIISQLYFKSYWGQKIRWKPLQTISILKTKHRGMGWVLRVSPIPYNVIPPLATLQSDDFLFFLEMCLQFSIIILRPPPPFATTTTNQVMNWGKTMFFQRIIDYHHY